MLVELVNGNGLIQMLYYTVCVRFRERVVAIYTCILQYSTPKQMMIALVMSKQFATLESSRTFMEAIFKTHRKGLSWMTSNHLFSF